MSREGNMSIKIDTGPDIRTESEPIESVKKKALFFTENDLCDGLLGRIQEAVLITNLSRQIVYANGPARKLIFNSDVTDYIGLLPGNALRCVYAINDPLGCGRTKYCKHCGALSTMIESRGGTPASADFSITRLAPDGSEAHELRAAASPLTMNGEQFIFFTLVDISDQKRRRVLERIFFHDILNTAGGLRGLAELLKETTTGEASDTAGLMFHQADQMVRDIEMQKILTEAENRDLKPYYGPVDTMEVATSTVRFFQAHHQAGANGLCVSPRTESVEFITDRNLVGRVLTNMIKNALEATRSGEMVTVSAGSDGEGVFFEVHNPGVMDSSAMLQVFKRSFTTKGAGRGLGTYGMKLLSEKYLGGQVEFRSSADEGTVFTAWYPYNLQAAAQTGG